MKLFWIAGVFASLLALPDNHTEKAQAAEFAPPTFIAGVWRGDMGGATVEEYWSPLAGGMMLGAGRVLKDDKTLAFEHLRVEKTERGWRYVALPNGQNSTSFEMVKGTKTEAVFENPKHDFPTRITYRMDPDGTLFALVEGTRDGKPASEEFRFKRAN